jgi:preprotein translocase subunit SecA
MSVTQWLMTDVLGRFRTGLVPGRPQHLRQVADVRRLVADFRGRSDGSLGEMAGRLREAVAGGVPRMSPEVLLPAFALAAEALRRTLAVEVYDVQLQAGLVLAGQAVAEMQTGEGKTLAAVAPAFLHALDGRGVHVMTVNAYLAERDWRLLLPAFQWLGLSAGLLRPGAPPDEKRAAYECHVTYGPGCEFGFDYLRDQVGLLRQQRRLPGHAIRELLRGDGATPLASLQRGHAFAIVDEADSVMIDEAITPLVLAEGTRCAAADSELYERAHQVAATLQRGRDFALDPDRRRATLLRPGVAQALAALAPPSTAPLRRGWARYVEQALAAQHVLRRDVDYVVRDDSVVLVDESTGRLFDDRSWQDGLHQAVEAKEGVSISGEQLPLASIARQRYFRRYRGLSGMTGTAATSAWEFRTSYELPVVAIPPRRPCVREIRDSRYFASVDAKWAAVAAEIASCVARQQPVLVGTRNIENSELLARLLDRAEIPYQLLNGKQDAEEAVIVARAGQAGTVTIATNMAGRGTDIVLGPGVAALGGLHVIATEHHDSPRIDRQLIGRSARQGDPGSCRFFVSAEDRLLTSHAPALARRLRRLANEQGEVAGDFSRQVVQGQQRAERQHYQQRQQWLAYDSWRGETLQRLEGRR